MHNRGDADHGAAALARDVRKLATQNSAEIRDAVEDGKKRMANLIEQGAAAALTIKTS